MDIHLSTEEIKGYLARTLAKNDFKRVGNHVHSCESCYQRFLGRLQERFPIVIDLDELAGMRGWHLEGEELSAFVEGRSDELEFECATLHLQECSPCMQKVSAAFEHTLEYPRSNGHASSKPPSFWPTYLPGFQSISLPRLQLAVAAAFLFALALIAWAVLQPKSEKSQLAGAQPPETISPDPSQQPTVPGQPAPGTGSNIGKKLDESMPDHVPARIHSDKPEARRQEEEFEQALLAKNLTMPVVIEMLDRTPAIAVRGNPSFNPSFKIISPFATLVKSDRPTFRWTELSGATSYTVSVFDAALNLIRTSEPLTETQWSMPEPLEAGIVYTWTVTAVKDRQEIVAPAPPARAEFKILGNAQLDKLSARIRGIASKAARGVAYAEAGLLDDADAAFEAHLSERPNDNLVRRLLQEIRSWRATDQ